MGTKVENTIEVLIFDVAEELQLTELEVRGLDVGRICAEALTEIRLRVSRAAALQRPRRNSESTR